MEDSRHQRGLLFAQIRRDQLHIPAFLEECALEYLGGYRVDAVTPAAAARCEFLLQVQTRQTARSPGTGWKLVGRERRNTNDEEITAVYRRTRPAARPSP